MKLKTFLGLFGLLSLPLIHGCDLGNPLGGGGGTGGEGLTGIIVNPRGVPVAGAKIRMYPEPVPALSKAGLLLAAKAESTTTGPDGSFKFSKLGHGRYNLTASVLWQDTALALFIGGIDLVKSIDLGTDTLRLAGSLRLLVRDSANSPVAGATCSIGGSPWSAISDASGSCLLEGVAPGTYRVHIAHQNGSGLTDTLTVSSGQLRDGGVATLSTDGSGIPANWLHVSALGYAFFIPPEMELEYEGYGIDSWDAVYSAPGMRLYTGAGMIGPLERPFTYPEYSEEIISVGAGETGLLVTYRVPDSILILHEGLFWPYSAGLQLSGQYFSIGCDTRDDQDRALLILRSVRKWMGPGSVPLSRPAPPALAGPAHGDSVTVDSTLSWLNAKPTNVSSYRVQVFTDTASAAVREEIVTPDPASKTFLPRFSSAPLSLSPGRYFWRVIAEGGGGSTPSSWRRFVIRDWKYLTINGYNFRGPLDWIRSDSTTYPDSAWIQYWTFRNARGWLRLVETNERSKQDLTLMENYATAGEIPLSSASRRATLVTYTETQGSQTLQRARVDFSDLSEDTLWMEDVNHWFEAGASTPAGWEEVQAALASLRIVTGLRPNPPAVRTLVSPANGAAAVGLSPTLSWKAIDMNDFGQFFRVQVFVDTPYAAMVVNDSANRSSSTRDAENYYHTVGPLKPGTTYYWRVLAWATSPRVPGDTSVSELRKFTTSP
jgi:hypothetical protein